MIQIITQNWLGLVIGLVVGLILSFVIFFTALKEHKVATIII